LLDRVTRPEKDVLIVQLLLILSIHSSSDTMTDTCGSAAGPCDDDAAWCAQGCGRRIRDLFGDDLTPTGDPRRS